MYPLSALLRASQKFTIVELSQFEQGKSSLLIDKPEASIRLPIGSVQKFETDVKKAIPELAETAGTHDVTVFCENDAEKKRFKELLEQHVPGLSDQLNIEM